MSDRRFSFSRATISIALFGYALLVVLPMVWLFLTSLKADREIFLHPFAPPNFANPEWSNFSRAWVDGQFGKYFFNSILITSTTVVATVLLAAMAAYAVARFTFFGARVSFYYFLAGLMVPLQLAIVPLFFQMRQLHLLDSLCGLFFVYVAFSLPFSIFILTGFFRSLPTSLHEAAVLDGANEWQAFRLIMLPLARPGLVTVGIFLFLGTWNEYFIAFICLSGEGSASERTLPLGLANLTIVSQYRSDWGVAFAGLVLMTFPALLGYILLQKQLTRGITAGALKA